MRYDLVVIGAGPAGLAGARAAAGLGRSVGVLDLAARAGGQFYRHRPDGRPGPGQHGWARFQRLRADCAARGVVGYQGHRVVTVVGRGPFTVYTSADRGESPVVLHAAALLLATGGYDRPLPFPGWDLPGVLTAGGAQAMVKGNGVLPGRRVVVAGSGPFLLPVAAGLARAGAAIPGVFEAAPVTRFARLARYPEKFGEAAGYLATFARYRISYRPGHAVLAAHGTDRLTGVTVARVDPDWRPRPGTERRIQCDTLAVGYGFVPNVELGLTLGCATGVDPDGSPVLTVDHRQRTSVPGVFAAGEVTGIGGAELAEVTGELAGLAAGGAAAVPARLLRTRARLAGFARDLPRVFGLRDGWLAGLTEDTVVCRCEEVRYGAVAKAVAELGATDARSVKLCTRAGMGWCQGRMCGPALVRAVAELTGNAAGPTEGAAIAKRELAQPVRLGELARYAHTEEDAG